ncbi:hypothetical protein QJS66_18530 [Kocuria rhizophila]|nr:hypothetical protein QJS66_18530 [Kocuria rhizophila]
MKAVARLSTAPFLGPPPASSPPRSDRNARAGTAPATRFVAPPGRGGPVRRGERARWRGPPGERRRRLQQDGARPPRGARPLRICTSRTCTPFRGRRAKKRFVHSLAALEPDLVMTPVNLPHRGSAVPAGDPGAPVPLPRRVRPGVQLLFAPRPKPARYLCHTASERRTRGAAAAHRGHAPGLRRPRLGGAHQPLPAPGGGRRGPRLLRRRAAPGSEPHRFPEGEPTPADVRIGVARAPYLRTLDRFAADRADIVFADAPRRPGLPARGSRAGHRLTWSRRSCEAQSAPGRPSTCPDSGIPLAPVQLSARRKPFWSLLTD